MKLAITQQEIDQALRTIVTNMGVDLTGKKYSVEYSLARKNNKGLTAQVVIEAADADGGVPDFGLPEETKATKTTVKTEDAAPVEVSAETAEVEPEPETAAGSDASIFGDE